MNNIDGMKNHISTLNNISVRWCIIPMKHKFILNHSFIFYPSRDNILTIFSIPEN